MSQPIQLAFLWHMHQPLYRVGNEHVCTMPWVRMHSIRSYYDMVRVLEEFPKAHVTINLVPSLIEQIRAYESGASDLFWETGAIPAEALSDEQKRFVFQNFFTAQEHHMIRPLPAFARLFERRKDALHARGETDAWQAFDTQDYRDLQAVFDLCWFGFMACED
ncbi:MAG: glycoside hydrolase, partial [Chrysiogenetes bacterium]|nr:glycoside hydrolase [Chrysiogenetes bacterium]